MNFDRFRNNNPYPKKRGFYSHYVYKKGELRGKGTCLIEIAKTLVGYNKCSLKPPKIQLKDKGYVIESIFDDGGYKEKVKEYRDEDKRLLEEFKKYIFEVYGCRNDDINNIVFSRAWDKGHSGGLNEVVSYFEDDIEFVNAISNKINLNE